MMKRSFAFATGLLALGALTACDQDDLDSGTLAQAGELRLGVDEVTELLADSPELPPQADVAEAVAEIWLDYALLADFLHTDPEFETVDMEALVEQELEQQLVMQLRDEVIDEDPEVTDAQVRQRFEEEGAGERIRARHILLSFPDQADEEARAEVLAEAESLRERVVGGEDFAELAEEHSDDPGSAAQGGDLGFFERGEMVGPFEDAAFDLQPGELSDVVETPFGAHIIRVEEREQVTFEDRADDLREQIREELTLQAESIYVAEMEEEAQVQVAEGAVERVRALAEDADEPLEGEAAEEALVEYRDGAYTAEDFRTFLASQPPEMRAQIEQVGDQQIQGLLEDLARGDLLLARARSEGLEISQEDRDDMREEFRTQYRTVAEQANLTELDLPDDPEARARAIEEEVSQRVAALVRGEEQVHALGPLSAPLRAARDARISSDAAQTVAERVADARGMDEPGEQPLMPPTEGVPEPPQPQDP